MIFLNGSTTHGSRQTRTHRGILDASLSHIPYVIRTHLNVTLEMSFTSLFRLCLGAIISHGDVSSGTVPLKKIISSSLSSLLNNGCLHPPHLIIFLRKEELEEVVSGDNSESRETPRSKNRSSCFKPLSLGKVVLSGQCRCVRESKPTVYGSPILQRP